MKHIASLGFVALLVAGCAHHEPPPPPPPPPAAPMPPADPSATAYFDYNKANLTAEAQQAIASEASLIGQFHYQHIVITGYCDAAEARRHGCADLGGRRADAARDELVRLGVTATDVQVIASEKLFVDTPAGAREPGNRRVVIMPN